MSSGAARFDAAAVLDELRTIAYEGLAFAENPYDRTRYERLRDIALDGYTALTGLTKAEVDERFRRDLGSPTPKIGATAVAVDERGLVLLQRRADDGRWGLPGGWLGPSESPEQAVVREVREETGIEVEVVRLALVHWMPAQLPSRPHSMVGLVYEARPTGGELQHDHESLDVAWRDPETVTDWHIEHGEQLRAVLAKRAEPP
jgi:8-oxo-dGTP pyrophosphatase MutT (NUDIX family)